MVITLWKADTVLDIMKSRVEKFQKPRKNYGRKRVMRLGPKSRSAVFQKRRVLKYQRNAYRVIKITRNRLKTFANAAMAQLTRKKQK